MITKNFLPALLGSLLLISAPNWAAAQCETGNCGGAPCATGNCGTGHCGVGGGGCIGRFLSAHHGGNCHGAGGYGTGACLTCENIWDGYCESKSKCLHDFRLPHPKSCGLKLGCLGGCCNPCAPGVGLYGRRGGCCPPHCGLLGKLFHHHKASCDAGCCEPACDSGEAAAPAEPMHHAPAEPAPSQPAPVEEAADPIVPPAPPVAEQAAARPQSFDWLQRALKLN